MSKSEGTAAAVGGRARTAIRGSAMAQRDVAGRIGLDETKLSKSLGGTRRFSADELLALATVTGVTVQWLLTGGGDSGSDVESVSATPPPETLPSRHPESEEQALRRRTLVERAWWLFAEHGYDGVRISDIADAAGASSASVHYYFPSKRDVFAEVLRYSVKLAFDRQSARLTDVDDPASRLKTLVRLQMPADRLRRAEWSIWLQTWAAVAVDGDRFEHGPSYRRWWETVRGVIAEGIRTGAFTDAPPDRTADILTAYIDGLGIRVLTGLLSPREMAEQVDNFIDRNLIAHALPIRTVP
ncbi:TetR/AcrR family transcriptional regulator [Tomitella gaofuii]|uniref:TetR/AcrR family transcriptional regulator n=1 Tax=Tomitella gaofuii TaxID=2760083 RepID=UPI001C713A3A|nr:TetR/AcrR family transcriptional regulator [Tomitella gaofuii]